jgi:hypothetical protein
MQSSMSRLVSQGDKLFRIEESVDSAAHQTQLANDGTKTLRSLNNGMVSRRTKGLKVDDEIYDRHVLEQSRREREGREAIRKEYCTAKKSIQDHYDHDEAPASRAVDPDDVDELAILEHIVQEIKHGAERIGPFVDAQSAMIDRISVKVTITGCPVWRIVS